jgi:hypothetical protein
MKVLLASLLSLSLGLAAQTTNRQPSTPPENPGQTTNRQPNAQPANPGQTTNRQPHTPPAGSGQATNRQQGTAPADGGMPKPAPEMERLSRMLQGRWSTEERHEPSEMMPQGGAGKGMEAIRPGPGKLTLIAEYASQTPMGEFSGIGIITWEAGERAYRIHWTDNTMNGMTTMTGRWQGEQLVFTGEEMLMGKKVFSRHAFTEIKPDTFTYTIDMGPAADQLKRAVTIKYTKVNMADVMNRRNQTNRPQ